MSVFTPAQARRIDGLLTAAAARRAPTRALLELLTITLVCRLFPMSLPNATDAARAAAGEYDTISPRRLGHYLRRDRWIQPAGLRTLATAINGGVIGGRGHTTQRDAREAIATSPAAVIYLDPPYPGTTGYGAYGLLDTLLGDDLPAAPAPRLADLHPHPANANVMDDAVRATLRRNLDRERICPLLIVRPLPDLPDGYQVLDGHQRLAVLRELGWPTAPCFCWPCDDASALILLATLNRLHGEDVPAQRASLLQELTDHFPLEELATLLPEDADAITQTLTLIDLDPEALLAELVTAAAVAQRQAPRVVSFAVTAADEGAIEAAVATAMAPLVGPNRRGRALAAICRVWQESRDA